MSLTILRILGEGLAGILCCDQANKLSKLPLELCLDNIITTEQLLLLLPVT